MSGEAILSVEPIEQKRAEAQTATNNLFGLDPITQKPLTNPDNKDQLGQAAQDAFSAQANLLKERQKGVFADRQEEGVSLTAALKPNNTDIVSPGDFEEDIALFERASQAIKFGKTGNNVSKATEILKRQQEDWSLAELKKDESHVAKIPRVNNVFGKIFKIKDPTGMKLAKDRYDARKTHMDTVAAALGQ